MCSQTWRYLTEGVVSNTWLNQLVIPPDGLGGGPSQALRDWVVSNADKLILQTIQGLSVVLPLISEDSGTISIPV